MGRASGENKFVDRSVQRVDSIRVGYDLVRAYVYALVVASIVTVVWLAAPHVAATPHVASLWFVVAGFGGLTLLVFVLSQYARRT